MVEEGTEPVISPTPEQTPERSPVVTDIPEWLSDPKYGELLGDDTAKNILSRYQEPDEVIKALVEKEKVVRSGFKIPDNLTDAQIAELRPVIDKLLEIPEKPEGYEMVRPEEIDDSMDLSEQTKMEIRAAAKEAGVGQKGLQSIYETALRAIRRSAQETETEVAEQLKAERRSTIAEMQKYWGPQEYLKIAGDPENKKPGLIDKYVKTRAIDDDEFKDLGETLRRTGVGNHPLLFKVMGDAARMWQILEGEASEPGEFHPSKGNAQISAERRMASMYPNTPASLGGGKPG